MSRIARLAIATLVAGSALALTPPSAFANTIMVDTPGGACSISVTDPTGVSVNRIGNDCIVKFTNASTIGWVVPTNIANNSIHILIVGGGGGGNDRTDNTGWVGGGGGGGDYLDSTSASVTPNQTDSITVGSGGTHGFSPTNGGSSIFIDKYTITSIGGGGGGGLQISGAGASTNNAGANGGSGGGGGTYNGNGGAKTGVGSGSAGGAAHANCCASGGGGGAGGAGGAAPDAYTGGAAGPGLSNNITGTSLYYAAGGAGIGRSYAGTTSNGGVAANSDASANTGSGGGGGAINSSGFLSQSRAGNGGSGVVIIRYTMKFTPTLSISISPSSTSAIYRARNTIQVSLSSSDGRVTFYAFGKAIPGCRNVATVSSVATCIWKPSIHALTPIVTTLASSGTITGSSISTSIPVLGRSGNR